MLGAIQVLTKTKEAFADVRLPTPVETKADEDVEMDSVSEEDADSDVVDVPTAST